MQARHAGNLTQTTLPRFPRPALTNSAAYTTLSRIARCGFGPRCCRCELEAGDIPAIPSPALRHLQHIDIPLANSSLPRHVSPKTEPKLIFSQMPLSAVMHSAL